MGASGYKGGVATRPNEERIGAMFHIATSHEQSNVMRDDVREKVRWRARRERAEHSSVVVERDECHAAWMSRKYRHRRKFFVAAW